MGNWTDRFDPETVDEIKRCEVGEGDFLLAERLAMHKGVESVFGFHVNCLGLGKPYWEKGVYLGDVLDFFDRHGETLIEKRAGSWHGDSTEVAKASECLQKGLAQFGLTLAQARERYGKREKARYRKWAETVAFFATDCSFLDIANLVDRSVAQVVHEIGLRVASLRRGRRHGGWSRSRPGRCDRRIHLHVGWEPGGACIPACEIQLLRFP